MNEKRIHKSELDLLKWIGKAKKGRTVEDTKTKFGGTRQGAYGRLERALKKGLLDFDREDSDGPRQRVRYRLSGKGREVVGAGWRKVSERIMERR